MPATSKRATSVTRARIGSAPTNQSYSRDPNRGSRTNRCSPLCIPSATRFESMLVRGVEQAVLAASLLSGLISYNSFLAAADLVENDVRRGFPEERFRFVIPVGQPLIDGSL
jgi:hypothetical protein